MAYNALSTSGPPVPRLHEVTVSDHTSSYSSATMTGPKGTVSNLSQTPMADVPLSSTGDPPRQDSSEKHAGRPSAPTPGRTQYRVFTHFQWEILSILLSIGIIVAMFVLLAEYHGKIATDWQFPINLSTLLALLATIMRAVLFVPITSIISQAKWKLFGTDQPRPLQDLQDIDQGSRSLIGALNIVPLAARASIPTLIAVMLSIVSLGIGPFVQQAIGTEPCAQTVPGQAMVPYTHFVESTRPVDIHAAWKQQEIAVMMRNALSALPQDQGNDIRFQCSTGNCTFDNGSPAWSHQRPGSGPRRNGSSVFSTMAMCHKCLDMKDFAQFNLTKQPEGVSGRLPNGLRVQLAGAGPTPLMKVDRLNVKTGDIRWAEDKLDPATRHLASVAVGNITMFTFNNEKDDLEMSQTERLDSVVASTCILYACTRTYDVSITNGELSEELIATTPADEGPKQLFRLYPDSDFEVKMNPCWVGDFVYLLSNETNETGGDIWSCSRNGGRDPPIPNDECGGIPDVQKCYYRQSANHAVGMAGTFQEVFNLNCDDRRGIYCMDSKNDLSGNGAWGEAFFATNITSQKVEDFFASLATTISNRYRMSFGGSKPHFIESMREPPYGQVHGVVHQTNACNVVRLEWLAFPTAIMALTLIILLWTMAESWMRRKDRPVWKDSILPFLLYSHRFKREVDGNAGSPTVVHENHDVYGASSSPSSSAPPSDNKTLLETGEMEDIARDMQVRFEWPHTGRRRDAEVDSLLQQ
ncbi:hypothetical protein PG993_012702 [Apiospora rasikravindrae]|uniref:Uncharacterized protein n=1 Tax=Apiospora rasikravindrae TaxID=990691 RepID=A0ABR1S4Z7_9PEZI